VRRYARSLAIIRYPCERRHRPSSRTGVIHLEYSEII
jgi:hypothetical protein